MIDRARQLVLQLQHLLELFQPFVLALYTYSFITMLVGVVVLIV